MIATRNIAVTTNVFNTGYLPTIHLLAESAWSSGRGGQWVAVSSQGVGQQEPLAPGGLHEGNELAVKDLIAAVEENRQPLANAHEARKTIEMIAAIFDSHRVGGPVRLPLENRQNPLSMLS